MDKDKTAESLQKKGYNVKNVGGVLQFFYPEDITDYFGYVAQVAKELEEIGYNSSWGCRYSKEENRTQQDETEENKEEEE